MCAHTVKPSLPWLMQTLMPANSSLPRLLHVSTAKTWRGGEQQIAYLYHELDALGVPQRIVCAKDSSLEAYCQENDIDHQSVVKKNSFDLSFAKQLKKIAAEFNADLMHVHDSHGHTFTFVAGRLFCNRLPYVVSRRVDFSIANSFLSKLKYNDKHLKNIICVSDAIRKIIQPSIKNPEVLSTVHDGIDLTRYESTQPGVKLREAYKVSPEHRVIGVVAALVDHKDIFTFINMANELNKRGVAASFFIVGEGKLRPQLEARVNALGLSGNVIFTGFVDHVLAVIKQFDVFMLTSKLEGLGTSILDAMACGVPVVATSAGGIPEMVEHGVSGLLAPVGDASRLVDNVMQVLNDQALAQSLVAGGKQRVRQFDKSIMAEKTLAIYQNICY